MRHAISLIFLFISINLISQEVANPVRHFYDRNYDNLNGYVNKGDVFPSDLWHNGDLTFKDGSITSGLLKYDLDNNVLMLKSDGMIKTYNPAQVQNFQIQDAVTGLDRRFQSLSLVEKGNRRARKFFEIIYQNKTSLVAREFIEVIIEDIPKRRYYHRNRSIFNEVRNPFNERMGPAVNTSKQVSHDFYLVRENGVVVKIESSPKRLLRVMPFNQKELKSYIKENRLDLDKMEDLVELVSHYNSLI